jgi:membrane-bound serine protease (ClpP class)
VVAFLQVWLSLGFLVLSTSCSPSFSLGQDRTVAAPFTSPTIVVLRIEGVINPVQARYVERSVENARARKASALLVSLDTPGGLVSSMEQIVSTLTNSGLPVIGLVENATAQASSAGAFILLASDLAAMQPDTRVGAAHPIGAEGKLDEIASAKATNSLVSLARSLAARRGRSEAAAEAMVRDSVSYTASEAKDKQVIEWIVPSRSALLDQLRGHSLDFADRKLTFDSNAYHVEESPLSLAERVLDRLADPTLASILVSIGVLGIMYELSAPGIGMGGIIGITSLLLGLMGMSVLPINLVGALLMFAGLAAIAFELHVPTHGLVGFGGVLSFSFGGLMLFDATRYFGAMPQVDWHIQSPVILLLGASLLLLAAQASRALEAKPSTGSDALVGIEAEVTQPLEPALKGTGFAGTVRVQGVYWRASAPAAIERGARVEIVEVSTRPLLLQVRRSRKERS